jgi:4-oxalocrotonate tautomerase
VILFTRRAKPPLARRPTCGEIRVAIGKLRHEAAGEGRRMPYVNIRITREGTTASQKAEIIKGVTDVLVAVLNKDPNSTFVVIDEVDLENWGAGGLPVPEFRKRAQQAAKAK